MSGQPRMGRALVILRIFWVVVFAAGSVVHVVLGGSADTAGSYSVFGRTALVPALAKVWDDLVMPNVRALTLMTAAFELGIAVLLCLPGTWRRLGAWAALGFFAFLLVLGCGFPGLSGVEDFAKNRLPALVMATLMLPFAVGGHPCPARG